MRRFSLYDKPAKSSRVARNLPLPWPPVAHQRIVANAWLFVPEGPRRKLAGGKPAPAGAAPGCSAERAMPQRGIGEGFGVARPAASPSLFVASGRSGHQRSVSNPDQFFDAPLGHRATRPGFRGRRSLARTCPRLISSGVPPGREPGGHAVTQGNNRGGMAHQTPSIAAPPLGVHPSSVADFRLIKSLRHPTPLRESPAPTNG